MNLLSILIMNLCLMKPDIKCVEQIHICMRDNFQVQFFDTLTWQQEIVLPAQIEWCDLHE